MEKESFKVEIIGKDTTTSWLFGKKYIVALKFENGVTKTRKVSFDMYCDLSIGEKIHITMYSNDGESWYFSKEEVE